METDNISDRIAYIGLGANLGKRRETCLAALALLDGEPSCRVMRRSGWHETEPVGMESSNLFINAVAELRTSLPADDLMALLLKIEKQLGRRRSHGVTDRTVDLDLLYVQGVVTGYPDGFMCMASQGVASGRPDKNKGLVVPHPAIPQRRFVLEPWAELVPDLVVEPWGKSVKDMLSALGPDDQAGDSCPSRGVLEK